MDRSIFTIQGKELFYTMEEIIVIASRYPDELLDSIASVNIITCSAEEESKTTASSSYGSYHTQNYQVSYQDQSGNLGYYMTGLYYNTVGERENSRMIKKLV